MRVRVPDLILLAVLIVGGDLAWRSARERARLTSDHDRLVRAAGDLPISDPAKAHFRAIETGEPLHFAWRVHVPAHSSMIIRSRKGTILSVSSGATPEEFIARVRLREDEQGTWHVYQSFQGGSSRSNFGGKDLDAVLHRHAAEVLVEQLGAKETAAVAPDGPGVLLRLTLPEAVQAEARKSLPPYEQSRILPDLYLLEFGPERPKPSPPPPGP